MKILILGGTGFVGRILTENLLSRGISPVLFNRGKRHPDIFRFEKNKRRQKPKI
jgi:uncharacterized protein YbjT (DUF2867 family)